MRSSYYDYNNSISIEIFNDCDDLEIIGLIIEALRAKAKTALEDDNYESALKFLERLTAINEHIGQMMDWNQRHKGEDTDE